MRAVRAAVSSFLIVYTSGCGETPAPQSGAGELVVARENLTIGSIEDGPEAFGRITGLTQDASGRILVADYQASEIRVFSPNGEYLFGFGRAGAGPGELSGPCCLAWAPNGTLWIRDTGNQRYSGFEVGESSAEFVTTLPMGHTDGMYSAQTTFTAGGDLIDVGHRIDRAGVRELVRFAIGASGTASEMETLAVSSPEELGGFTVTRPGVRYFFYQPYSARDLIAHGPGGRWAHGVSSAYEIAVRGGDSTRQVVGQAATPALSSDERASAVQRMESDAERAGMSANQLPYGVPDSKPPLQTIFFDELGQLWVELSQTDGEPRIAEVWDGSGTAIRTVQWPRDVSLASPAWVGEHSALGIRRDSLGVEHVVRLTF